MLNFFQKFRDFISHATHSRTMVILVGLVLLVAISITVIVSQQKQTIRQRASENPACEIINNIEECMTFSASDSNVACKTENGKCRIGNDIYQCGVPPIDNPIDYSFEY